MVTVRKNFRDGGNKNWVLTAYDKEAADNGNRVTTKVIEGKATPHTASTGKGSEKPRKKQEKQSVFDKAKEILLSTGNCKIINLSEENILWGFKI